MALPDPAVTRLRPFRCRSSCVRYLFGLGSPLVRQGARCCEWRRPPGIILNCRYFCSKSPRIDPFVFFEAAVRDGSYPTLIWWILAPRNVYRTCLLGIWSLEPVYVGLRCSAEDNIWGILPGSERSRSTNVQAVKYAKRNTPNP
jgi:hypothetical protein